MAYTPPGKTREKVMSWVRGQLARGESPSVREVQAAFRFRSVESARAHLLALVAEGRLVKREGARGYRLPGPRPFATVSSLPLTRVALLGRVPAGGLSEAVENAEGWLDVSGHRPGDALFALRVEGESMRDAGILNGDVVIVRRQPTARSGEVVVAMVDGEATVKTLRRPRAGGKVILEPRNDAYESIVVPAGAVVILGKVVEVRRWLDGALPLEDEPR